MHILGLGGMIRREYTYPAALGLTFWNQMSSVGAFTIALSVLLFIILVIRSLTKPAGLENEDPWDARTLEWMTSSPPPEYNFAEIPVVTHRDEWWHRKYTEDDEGRLVKLPSGGAVEVFDHAPANFDPHTIHMPSPSYWPFFVGAGLPIIGYGFVFKLWWLVGLGALVLAFGINGWAIEPPTDPESDHSAHAAATEGAH
jgi:cytochrome c oxidase subunit I